MTAVPARSQSAMKRLAGALSFVCLVLFLLAIEQKHTVAAVEAVRAEVDLQVEGFIRVDAPLLSLAIRSILENLLGSAQRQDSAGDWLVSIRSHEELFTHRVDITTRRLAHPLSPADLSGGSIRPVSARRARKRAMNDVRELGLGLSIASHIIDLHQGELQIELKSDGSNSYSVILPGHARATVPASAAPSA